MDLGNFRKKGCFLSFEWEKTNFTTFAPLEKPLGESTSGPSLEKILPTPMNKGVRKGGVGVKIPP